MPPSFASSQERIMVRPALRSRSLKRKKITTPGGEARTHYRKEKPSPAVCANCGGILHGVPRQRPIALGSVPKSRKKPERPYGGNLCSACMRQRIKDQFRK